LVTTRIIPRLDIKGPNLVKGIHLEGLRVLGKPERFARHYCETGADELIYMDVVASLYGRNNLLPIVARTSSEIFVPLTAGGGIRTLEDVRDALRSGADKVAINTAAISRPEFVAEAARRFGSSTIVVSIEAVKQPDGTYQAFTDNGRERTGVDAEKWARRAEELGAGELLVTSVDREGTGNGFDVELVRRIAESVGIPVIASGGAGSMSHIRDVILDGRADAVAVASMLHYHFIEHHRELLADEYAAEGNVEFLKRPRMFSRVEGADLPAIKEFLAKNGVGCRIGGGMPGA
jgi:cyclase